MNWTPAQAAAYESRQQGKLVPTTAADDATPDGQEEKLCQAIIRYCDARRWICARSRPDRPTTTMPGWPDFTILADGGRLFFVECKTRTGKLSPAQLGFHGWAERLGHRVHVVRSVGEFLEVVKL